MSSLVTDLYHLAVGVSAAFQLFLLIFAVTFLGLMALITLRGR